MDRDAAAAIQAFFACYSEGRPADFDGVVAADYQDHGHEPPGRGPDGARADYEQARAKAGGITRYAIDALVVDGEHVAAAWTGTMPCARQLRGLSLYRVRDGLVTSTRHTRMT